MNNISVHLRRPWSSDVLSNLLPKGRGWLCVVAYFELGARVTSARGGVSSTQSSSCESPLLAQEEERFGLLRMESASTT